MSQIKEYIAKKLRAVPRLTAENAALRQENERLKSPWTPIRTAEDLPKHGQEKLWQTVCGNFYIGYFYHGDGKSRSRVYRRGGSSFEFIEEFVAWRELPEPYAPPVNDSDDACKAEAI